MAPESDLVPLGEAVGQRTHPLTGVVQGGLWGAAATAGLFWTFVNGDSNGLGAVISIAIALVGGLLLGLAFGFLQWSFTRYVIDGQELRITSGIITKKSRRVPYERLQSVDIAEPLLARIFGLAELRIETAGGSDSRTSLQFVKLDHAQHLRTVLLDKAHGVAAVEGEPRVEEHRSLITVVPPRRLIIGTVLSLDFLFAAAGALVLLVAAVSFEQYVALVGGFFPLMFWLFQIVMSRVVQQWDFTLSRGEQGLRIERGLLSRTSQTIPFERVQGIAIKEPFVWRRLGWQRLEVDVAGYASAGSENSGTDTSSTLLPITDPALARALINELIPGSEPTPSEPLTATAKSRPFAPIGWRYRWVDTTSTTFTAHEGWIERKTSIVPHHKTQSVELRQGPLARRRGVATLEVHTPQGPVNADGRNLDAADARSMAVAQLDNARRARN